MGRDGSLYELAQWYPRVCVYDDLRGWNTEPYLGQGEFYLEYGDYNLVSHRARGIHRRRDGHAAESDRSADADADLAPRAGGEVRDAGAHRHAGGAEERRRASEEDGHA